MKSLEKQKIENQINELIVLHIKTYNGKQGIRITDIFSGQTYFESEFLSHLPSDVKSSLDVLVKRLNAS